MLIVLFVISLLCIFFGWVITIKGRNDTTCRTIWYSLYTWDLDDHIRCIGYVSSVICAFFIIGFAIVCSTLVTADKQIVMYEEENSNIECRINEMVNNYMIYEKDTYSEFKFDDIMAAVTIYPELKSDELVKTQIDIYVENNNKIKQLKTDKIECSVFKWWLYFGN